MSLPRVKNLLVTGRPGCGKTTLIESVIRKFGNEAGGFFTREIRDHGVRKGFTLRTLEGRTGTLAHVEIAGRVRVGKYGVNVEALESLAVPAIRGAVQQKKIVVIDEIGRMEIASEEFRRAVLDALASDAIVLAAIQQHPNPFADAIKARPDACVFHLAPENRDSMRAAVEAALDQLMTE